MDISLQLQEALLGERLSPADQKSLKKYGVIWRTTASGHTIGIDPKSGKMKKGNPNVTKGATSLRKGAQSGKARTAAAAAKAAAKGVVGGAKKVAAEHGHESFWKKLGGKLKAVGKALAKAPRAAKQIYTDPEHRKKVFSKKSLIKGAKSVGEFAGRAAAKTWGHIKHEGHNAKTAAKALWRVRNTDVKDIRKTWKSLDEKERKAIKGTVKAAAMTIGGTVAGGHFGLFAIAKHFLAESLAVGAIMADQLRDGRVLTEEEERAAGEKVLQDAIARTVEKMSQLSTASEDEMAELAAKLHKKKNLDEDEWFEATLFEALEAP